MSTETSSISPSSLFDDGSYLFSTLNGNKVTIGMAIALLFNIVVSSFILLLNGLVLDTMVRQGKSKEAADLLVAGLALTDALMGVFVLWVTVYTIVYFQEVFECLARLAFAHSMMITGMLHLLGLTADRFLKIVTPYRYNDICQKWTVWIAMAAMWLAGIVLGSLPTLGWNGRYKPRDPDESLCNYFSIMDDAYLSFFMCVMSVIMILIIVLYAKLFFVARRHACAIAAANVQTNGVQAKKVWDHAWRYTKTVFLIIGVNVLCWFPTGIVVVMSITGILSDVSNAQKGDYMLYSSTVTYCNSLLNPLIYAIKIPAIRKRYRAVFCCCRKQDDHDYQQQSSMATVTKTEQSLPSQDQGDVLVMERRQ